MGTENTNPPSSNQNQSDQMPSEIQAVLGEHVVEFEETTGVDYRQLAADAVVAAKRSLEVAELDRRSEMAGLKSEIQDITTSIGGITNDSERAAAKLLLEQRKKELLEAQAELHDNKRRIN